MTRSSANVLERRFFCPNQTVLSDLTGELRPFLQLVHVSCCDDASGQGDNDDAHKGRYHSDTAPNCRHGVDISVPHGSQADGGPLASLKQIVAFANISHKQSQKSDFPTFFQ